MKSVLNILVIAKIELKLKMQKNISFLKEHKLKIFKKNKKKNFQFIEIFI